MATSTSSTLPFKAITRRCSIAHADLVLLRLDFAKRAGLIECVFDARWVDGELMIALSPESMPVERRPRFAEEIGRVMDLLDRATPERAALARIPTEPGL